MTKRETAQDLIDRVKALRLAGQTDDAEALREEAEAAVKACAPKDRKALTQDLEEAYKLEPATSAEVAITSYAEVAGVTELVDKGVTQAREAVDAGLKAADMAQVIATTLLDARLKMPNKAGLPDIIGSSKHTKNIAHDMFVRAREGVSEEDVDRWATHKSLAKAVRNRMSDVVVAFLRGLDDDQERARELFPSAVIAVDQGAFGSVTEAVYALYEGAGFRLPRRGRTEIAREEARKKSERLRALEAGQTPAQEDMEDEEELAADMQALERMEKSFIRLTVRARKLEPSERAALKARINEAIVSLSAQAANL